MKRRKRKQRQDLTHVQPAVYSIPEFCKAHGISQALYFRICKDGLGPEIFKVSSRTLISFEAAARWRAMMERRATSKTEDC